MQHLQSNTPLQGKKYIIERMLGQGGLGITYSAVQVTLNRRVAIKEFFVKEYCERDADTSHVTLGTASLAKIECEKNSSMIFQRAKFDTMK